jgi:glutathione S-transferase
MHHPPIRLRYFDARARAQFLRAYLTAQGIVFDDERVPLDEGFASWVAMRDDRARSGPLQRLPVLHYGDDLIPEALVIAGFLHEACGGRAALDADRNRQHEIIVSMAYTDLAFPIAILIWADLMFPGIDVDAYAKTSLGRIERNFDALEHALADWGWVATQHERPVTVADCLLWETVDQARTLFGSALELDDRPELARCYTEHPGRATFESVLASRPCQITGRPGEGEAIERIQSALRGPAAADS